MASPEKGISSLIEFSLSDGEVFVAQAKQVEVVIATCSIVSRYEEVHQWAVDQLRSYWGELIVGKNDFPFGAQEYYGKEMGEGLRKRMVSVREPKDPAELADWKRFTNRLEEQCAGWGWYPVERPLNLDPGYISQGKWVLASMKDRDHRIYLRDQVFAEVTLRYTRDGWEVNPWTYRDYRGAEIWEFADECRQRLRSFLQESDGFRR